ncbi:hypothetical protein COLO4_14376 [Corchorus olitorius]|uniref:Uncharacterized protein n=1 Tax=Corchorus olitorius TaxID=93759 RepID=A0A1R3JSH1_9ROSI|nr:hypothetical protein COLO4_14376 [Corchorus olitorius]
MTRRCQRIESSFFSLLLPDIILTKTPKFWLRAAPVPLQTIPAISSHIYATAVSEYRLLMR